MNVQIKFRGKDIKTNQWVYGGVAYLPKDGEYEPHITSTEFFEGQEEDEHLIAIEIRPETLGQYVGIPDMHLHGIFDGDIIRIHIKRPEDTFGTKSDFVVDTELHGWGLDTCWNHIKNSGYECSTHIMQDHEDPAGCNYEVIGNIYDTPDLLKQRKARKNKTTIHA